MKLTTLLLATSFVLGCGAKSTPGSQSGGGTGPVDNLDCCCETADLHKNATTQAECLGRGGTCLPDENACFGEMQNNGVEDLPENPTSGDDEGDEPVGGSTEILPGE